LALYRERLMSGLDPPDAMRPSGQESLQGKLVRPFSRQAATRAGLNYFVQGSAAIIGAIVRAHLRTRYWLVLWGGHYFNANAGVVSTLHCITFCQTSGVIFLAEWISEWMHAFV